MGTKLIILSDNLCILRVLDCATAIGPDSAAEPATAPEICKEAKDNSPGALQHGGSTSTVFVTLATDDDTADYTVGGGSIWVDTATVVGAPEGWKIQPPAGTEHAAWNDTIAQILAGGVVAVLARLIRHNWTEIELCNT